MWWLNHFLRTQERGLLEHALTPAPCVTFVASMFPSVPGGCWASLWGPSWLRYVPKSLTSNLGSWAHTLSKHTRLICPHILIRCGEMQKILLFFSLLCAYTMPVVRAAGSTGGTATVRRSRAMAMVSCREAWGGTDTQVSLAESTHTLPGSISCHTNGVLEAQNSHHEPAVLVGLSILQAESEKSTNCHPL